MTGSHIGKTLYVAEAAPAIIATSAAASVGKMSRMQDRRLG